MLSTNSLAAFSAATTTAAQRPSAVRLVREIVPPSGSVGTQKNAVPPTAPAIVPPRGSLLNLSV